MRVSLSRWKIVGTLVIGLALSSAGGCHAPGVSGWGWSTPSWMNFSNWGWGNSNASSVAQAKPATSAPKPSSLATPQATNSIATTSPQTGYPGATNPNYANSAYPATSRGYGSPYGSQPVAAYQQPGAPGQVQPTVGYQTGPYGMTSSGAPANGAAGYGQPSYAAGTGAAWNQPAASSGVYGAASSPAAGGYHPPEQSSPYSTANAAYGASAGYGSSAGYGASPSSSYGAGGYAQPSTSAPSYGSAYGTGAPSTSASPYGATGSSGYGSSAAPAAATGPWNGYSQPASTYNQSSSTLGGAPANPATIGYSPAASTVSTNSPSPYSPALTASAPAATPSSSYPAVPATLATDSSSYKPGSTAGAYGVQSAGYTQPQPAGGGAYNAGGAVNYGNTYTR